MKYIETVYVIKFDFCADKTWYSNQVLSFSDRNRANKRWLELKADKTVDNIRTSVEQVEHEIENPCYENELRIEMARCWNGYDAAMKRGEDVDIDEDYFIAECALTSLTD